MSTATKIRRSQATFLQFDPDRYFTPLEFYQICICLALQADPCNSPPLIALKWMLAYWRADADDGGRHDRAEMFFYGREGFNDCDWNTTLGELINQMTDGYPEDDLEEPMISAENVNTVISWAFDKFIDWEPEPVLPHDPTLFMKASEFKRELLQIARVVSMLAQFTDHFEEYETLGLAQFLIARREEYPELWKLLTAGTVNIEVLYGVGPTPDTRTLNINHVQWLIHYTDASDIAIEGPNEFSTKE